MITPGDVETYYKANLPDFVQPVRVRVSHILVADREKADSVLLSLRNGESFETLAKGLSLDQATAAEGGQLDAWIAETTPGIPGVGQLEDAQLLFSTEPGELVE